MASVFTESFEGGSNGADLMLANTGFDSIVGTCTFSNTSAAAGSLSASMSATASTAYVQNSHTAAPVMWYVWRVRISAMPAASTYLASCFTSGTKVADVRINTDGTLTVRDGNSAVITSSAALTTNAWHRIALRVQPGTASTGLQLKIYLGNGAVAPDYSGQASSSVAGNLDRVRFGIITNATFSYLLDDIETDNANEPDGYAPPTSSVLFEEDFEGGTNGADLSSSNSGVDITLGTAPTFTTTHHDGTLGAAVNTSTSSSAGSWPHDATAEAWYVWRVRLTDLPATSTYIFSALSATTKIADLRLNADGTLSLRDGSAVTLTSSVALTTGAWHRIAVHVVPGESLALKIYLDDAVDADYLGEAASSVSGTLTRARFGVVASGTLAYAFDTIVADSGSEPDGGDAPPAPVEDDLIVELFEGGTADAAITTGNTDATAVAGSPTFSTAAVQGGLGAHFSTSNAVSYLDFGHTAAESPWYSFYLRVPTLPAANIYVGVWRTGATKIADLRLDTNGALVLRDGTTARVTSTALLTAGYWHRVSVRVTPGGELRMRVYLGPNRHNPTPTFEGAGVSSISGDVDFFRVGVTTTSTSVLDVDRVLANTATEPEGLPPVTTSVWFYEDPTGGWVDVTEAVYYEHPTRGWEAVDPSY